MRIRPALTTAVLLALIAGLLAAAATPSRAAAASKPCWERVIDDWLDNGTIDKQYKPACYQQALKHVPEDLRDYSNITDAIAAALQSSLRGTGGGGSASPSGGSAPPSGGSATKGSGGSSAQAEKPRHLQNAPARSYYRRAIDNLGTTSADSLPIPLLVLAGLGSALLLTAGGLAARKRLRGRLRPPQAS